MTPAPVKSLQLPKSPSVDVDLVWTAYGRKRVKFAKGECGNAIRVRLSFSFPHVMEKAGRVDFLDPECLSIPVPESGGPRKCPPLPKNQARAASPGFDKRIAGSGMPHGS